MNDILPDEAYIWRYIEQKFSNCLSRYGYKEIRFPIVESTQLFKRTIGEVTDIVEKEMYTFKDLNGDSLTLRPEGTAGCVRACLQHGLLHNQQQKLWYMGPMFRHEKPQKGRYRQFHQFGAEVFGIQSSAIEVELIATSAQFWKDLGIENNVSLEINSLGDWSERQNYKNNLVQYLKEHFNLLDEDSKRRLDKNPLRILDSKNPEMQQLIYNAPKLIDTLGDASKAHFQEVCEGLERLGIQYSINPVLVRGLDYYGQTVFEWVTDKLGSQATVCAGGRYDSLVEHLGGASTPAVGYAMGIERLILLLKTLEQIPDTEEHPDVFIIADAHERIIEALKIAEQIRHSEKKYNVVVNTVPSSFKSQFKKADKSGARFAFVLGEEEVKEKSITIKDLRTGKDQFSIKQNEIAEHLQKLLE